MAKLYPFLSQNSTKSSNATDTVLLTRFTFTVRWTTSTIAPPDYFVYFVFIIGNPWEVNSTSINSTPLIVLIHIVFNFSSQDRIRTCMETFYSCLIPKQLTLMRLPIPPPDSDSNRWKHIPFGTNKTLTPELLLLVVRTGLEPVTFCLLLSPTDALPLRHLTILLNRFYITTF